MKKLLLICSILFLSSQFSIAQTTLTAGDIAIVGYNADGPDDFAFLLLTDITAGTEIKFTDNGWLDNTIGFTSGSDDSIITWSATTALATGTVVHIDVTTASEGSVTSGSGLDLNRFGDQLLAYQGTDDVNANFISAIHMNVINGTTDDANWDNTTISNDGGLSNLPNGLTNGVNALWVATSTGSERDNAVYNCINTNIIDVPALRTSINDVLNWNLDNFNAFTLNPFPCTFIAVTCSNISNFTATNVTGATADLTWDIVTEATSGYLVEVYNIGEDPLVTTPLFTEMVAAGTNVSMVTGLTEFNSYDAYINADCGAANGLSEIEMITFEATSCPRVPNVFINNVGDDSVAIGWTIVTEATSGYNIEIYLAGADPAVDSPVITDTGAPQTGGKFIEGLSSGTSYDGYVTSNCGAMNGVSASEFINFTTNVVVLTAGDIAIIGYNADGPDDFAFLLLTDITAGTEIKFTDNGWLDNTTGFTSGSGDSIITWSATTALVTGTIVHIDVTTASEGMVTSGSGLDLNRFGDQLLAYQGTDDVNANFISAIHMNVVNGATNDANWDNTIISNDGGLSNLPNGLTNGVNALKVATSTGSERDNAVYNCINTNLIDIPALRTSINDVANWNLDNFDAFTLNPFPCSFILVTCSNISNFEATNSTGTTTDLTWDIVTEATNGYLVEVYNTGEDPLATTPLFTEMVAAGTNVSMVTGLTEFSSYDAYINADCGAADGLSEIEMITFEATSCPRVTSLFLNNISDSTVSIGWSILPEATSGYNIEIYLAGADPAVDNPVATATGAPQTGAKFFENLTSGTSYDAYVTSNCGAMNGLSASEFINFMTTGETLGVGEFDANAFSFSPNPTDGIVTFKSPNNIDSITVYDLIGKEILVANPNALEFIIDLASYQSGIYIVKIKIGNTISTRKLIKN